MNSGARRKVIKDQVQDSRSTIVCLQETKMEHIEGSVVAETLGTSFSEQFAVLPSEGASGGILLAVHKDFYRLTDVTEGAYSITAKLHTTMAPLSWWITVVYGSQDDSEKLDFLNELRQIRYLAEQKWIIIGDFNMIIDPQDKSSNNLNHRIMGAFRNAVNEMELKEIKLQGKKFTWTSNRTHTRIDRAFCTADWEAMLPTCMMKADSFVASDHCPLIVVGA